MERDAQVERPRPLPGRFLPFFPPISPQLTPLFPRQGPPAAAAAAMAAVWQQVLAVDAR